MADVVKRRVSGIERKVDVAKRTVSEAKRNMELKGGSGHTLTMNEIFT